MKAILCTVGSNKVKCHRISLTKDAKVPYNENSKTPKKDFEEDTRIWKDLTCLRIGRVSIMKMTVFPKQSIESMESPPKYQ